MCVLYRRRAPAAKATVVDTHHHGSKASRKMSGFGGGYDAGDTHGGGWSEGGGWSQGGGFMPQSTQERAVGYGTRDGDSGRPGGGAKQDSLHPVTIHQLRHAEVDNATERFIINGKHVSLVTFIGRIMSCEPQQCLIGLKVCDCSGTIGVSFGIEPDDAEGHEAQKRQDIQELAWVRVVGTVRIIDGEAVIDAFCIRGVKDMNELTYHRLEVAKVFLGETRPKPSQPGTTPLKEKVSRVNIHDVGEPLALSSLKADSGLSPMENQVFNVLRGIQANHEGEEFHGASVGDIMSRMGSTSRAEVKKALEDMATYGHVYSTIDDDHYQTCDR